jgi:cytochrome c oxidase subunit IV
MTADIENLADPVAQPVARPLVRPAPPHETTPAKVSKPPAVHGQQHPIGMYLKVWGYLFVLSTMSYLVDYFHVEGALRSVLIVTFMFLKAGLIVSIFMHMAWERLALVYAILVPPLCLGTLVLLMAIESDYTFWTRIIFFGKGP